MTQIIYLVLHINYQKKNNNNKIKKMKNFLVLIWGPKWAMLTIVGPLLWAINRRGIKVIGLMNIQQIKKVFSKINL